MPNDTSRLSDRHLLGKACLMANDFYNSADDIARIVAEIGKDSAWISRDCGELLTVNMPQMEIDNPPDLGESVARISNFLLLFEQEFPTVFAGTSLSNYFESITGIDLQTLLEMLVAISAKYSSKSYEEFLQDTSELNLNRNIWFSTSTYSEEKVDAFFDLVLADYEQLITKVKAFDQRGFNEKVNFLAFRTYPLVKLSNESITCIDNGFLTESFLLGIYHTVFNALEKDKKLQHSFSQHWGDVFHIYVTNILRKIYPDSIITPFFPFVDFDRKEKTEAFDGIIECPNALILMQYKGGSLNADAKYSGKKELLLADLDKKFGRKKQAGVEQLTRGIHQAFNRGKRLAFKGIRFGHKPLIYPVLIVNELCLGYNLPQLQIRRWLDQQLNLDEIREDIRIAPLVILTVGELEDLTEYILDGKFTLVEFIEFYADSVDKEWFHPLAFLDNITLNGNSVFARFREERDITFKPNKTRENESSKVFDVITSKLKI